MRALTSMLTIVSLPALAGPLNDTGSDFCRDHVTGTDTAVTTTTTCSSAQGGQDARYGRDPAAQNGALTKVGGGSKGFDFTKIANNGTSLSEDAVLGSGASDWGCTYDNNTGLMWEVKTDDGGLRDKDWTYTWYDSVHNYGGNPGTASGGTCLTAGHCDTETFVADVNAAGLCGHSDWRLPTKLELYNLVDRGIVAPGPVIDGTYFPNAAASGVWSDTPVAGFPAQAWGVYFGNGNAIWRNRDDANQVRLVRAGH